MIFERFMSMLACSKCGHENPVAATVCESCGVELPGQSAGETDPLLGRRLGKNFVLRRNLGSGEIGVVYEAVDDASNRRVAVKVLHADVAATFGPDLLRWAKEASKVRHAKVATILGANRLPDGTTFIITEFVEGQTLRDVLKQSGRLSPTKTADILFQLCSALAPIHRAGRPHANLKPENVFVHEVDGKRVVRIVDVGSPVIFGAHHLSGERQVVGSPKYFSPEQAAGEAVHLASDQFTLGVIGYLLLTGALPFFGATPDQLLKAIVESDAKPIQDRVPTVPTELCEIIEQCLKKKPSERYGGLRGLATDLASAIKALRSSPSVSMAVSNETGSADTTNEGDPDATQAVDVSKLKLDQLDDERAERTVALAGDDELIALFDEAVSSTEKSDSDSENSAPNPVSQDEEPVDLDVSVGAIPEPLAFTAETSKDELQKAIAERRDSPRQPEPEEAEPNQSDPDEADLTAAMAAVIDVLGDGEDDGDSTPFDDVGSQPLFGDKPGDGVLKSESKGSLLPDDLLVGLDDELSDGIGDQPLTMAGRAEAPVASLSDFDEVEVLSEKDKKKRLARKTAALPKLGGLSRPWVVAFLFLLLVITALAAKVVMQEHAQEEEKLRIAKQRSQKADRDKRARIINKVLKVVTDPPGATGAVGGVAQGVTPYNQIVKGDKAIKIVLTKAGFQSTNYSIDPKTIPANGQPIEIRLVLVKAAQKKVTVEPDAALLPEKDGQFVPAVVREAKSGLRKVRAPRTTPRQSNAVKNSKAAPTVAPAKTIAPKPATPPKPSQVNPRPNRTQVKKAVKKRRAKKPKNTMDNPYD
ncbi:MAG: serine/threonine-protein kinase [Myxococcota bacterium]|nr:serine/threonine-protein kinase [Myxococcota bacterium]